MLFPGLVSSSLVPFVKLTAYIDYSPVTSSLHESIYSLFVQLMNLETVWNWRSRSTHTRSSVVVPASPTAFIRSFTSPSVGGVGERCSGFAMFASFMDLGRCDCENCNGSNVLWPHLMHLQFETDWKERPLKILYSDLSGLQCAHTQKANAHSWVPI